jgi:mono/diheme cytochrome c family protein
VKSAPRWLLILAALPLLSACDDMGLIHQAKDKDYRHTPLARAAAPKLPPGIVATDDAPISAPPVTPTLLARGQQRFDIYCAPCHGRLGDGNGMVAQRGFPAPPSYHIDRLRDVPSQHFYDVITQGYGAMYSYADRVAAPDRWAIAAYIRALQRSQDAKLAEVPADRREALQ